MHAFPPWLTIVIIAAVALTVGSFLNVVIYRLGQQMKGLPPGKKLGVAFPPHSFCPKCEKQIAWFDNLPVVSWIALLGKCRNCKNPISFQYPLVEIIYAAAVVLWWGQSQDIYHFLAGAILIAGLITGGVIDAETQRIPNKITYGLIPVLIVLAAMGGPERLEACAIGAAGGYLFMFGAVHLGRFLFGTKIVTLTETTAVHWKSGILKVQEKDKTLEESEPVEPKDLFYRKGAKVEIEGSLTYQIGEEKTDLKRITLLPQGIVTQEGKNPTLEGELTGQLKTIKFPREAMGLGDAKLVAMIGAVTGLQMAAYSVVGGAIAALIFAIIWRIKARVSKQNAPEIVAFGPWIAGAAICLLLWPSWLK